MSTSTNNFGIPKYSAFDRLNDWTADYASAFTLSPGFGAYAMQLLCKRHGDSLKVRGFLQTGTVAASIAYIKLMPGLHIDGSKLFANGLIHAVGTAIIIGGSPQSPVALGSREWCVADPSFATFTDQQVGFAFATSGNQFTTANVSNILNSGDTMQFEFEIPIKEFSM